MTFERREQGSEGPKSAPPLPPPLRVLSDFLYASVDRTTPNSGRGDELSSCSPYKTFVFTSISGFR